MVKTDAFLNGRFLPASEASLNIEDRSTLFGDGVYEVVLINKGALFQAAEHLNRLWQSAAAIEITLPHGKGELIALMEKLVEKSGVHSGILYMQLTRGVAFRAHHFPAQSKPTFFMVAREFVPLPKQHYLRGVQVTLLPDERWKRCDIKTLNLLPNVLAKEMSARKGFFDAIFYNDFGITEAPSSSVLAVFNGELTTAPQGPWILPGITRDTILNLAAKAGIPTKRRFIGKEEIPQATEVLLTSTRIGVIPVVGIDGRIIGEGRPGGVYHQLSSLYQALLDS